MTMVASELERRARKAVTILEKLEKAGLVIDGVSLKDGLKEAVSKNYKFNLNGNQLTCVINETKSKASETPKMVQVAWGVKASVILAENGNAVINAFVFDADRYDEEKASAWLIENKKNLEESFSSIQESMPAGSFEDITARIYAAIKTSNYFPIDNDGLTCFYIVCVFPDRVIVHCGDQPYQLGYTDTNGVISLGSPVKVTTEFVAMECKKLEDKGFGFDDDFKGLKVKEAAEKDASKRELVAVLIEEGISVTKNRYYPATALKEAAPLFAGLKNFIDHPTNEEERAKPERSINDWVSTIKESWYEDGKIMGKIYVHDSWFWEKIQDPVFRENIGLSINANGKRTIKEVGGKPMEVIEKIFAPKSVDWVTEPGARGRVAHLLESNNQGENNMEALKTVKLEEVKSARPDLITIIETETRAKVEAELQAKTETAVKEAVKPLQEKIDAMENEKIKLAESNKISELVSKSKLPKKAQEKVIAEVSAQLYNDEAKLTEAVNAKVKAELEYLKEVGGIKIGVNEGNANTGSGATAGLLKRLGIKETETK